MHASDEQADYPVQVSPDQPSCPSERDVPCCRRAKDLVQTNIEILHKVAAVLLEKEQIDGEEFQNIILEQQAAQYLKQDAPGVTVPYQEAVAA